MPSYAAIPNLETLDQSRRLEDYLPQNWSDELLQLMSNELKDSRLIAILLKFLMIRGVVAGLLDESRPLKITDAEIQEKLDYFRLEMTFEILRRAGKLEIQYPTIDNFLENRDCQASLVPGS